MSNLIRTNRLYKLDFCEQQTKNGGIFHKTRHKRMHTSVTMFRVYPAVLQSVCYYSDVVFETGSPADGGDASVSVVVKYRPEQTPLQTNLSFIVDTENTTKELLFPHPHQLYMHV